MKFHPVSLLGIPAFVAALSIGSNLLAQTAPPAPAGAAAPGGLSGGFAAGTLTPGMSIPFVSYYRGTSKATLDDIQLTDITKMEEGMEKEMAAVPAARTALLQASLTTPKNESTISARLDALASAELALALKRAEAWAVYQRNHKLTPDQVRAVATMIGSGGVSVGGGRGG